MKPDTHLDYRRRIVRVVRAVMSDPQRDWRLEDLAAIACLSHFHFHRIFRSLSGESPLDMVRRIRLTRAALALADGEIPVTEIAMDSGYDSSQAFARAFKSFTGQTPSAFRVSDAQRFAEGMEDSDDLGTGDLVMNHDELDFIERAPVTVMGLRHEGPLAPASIGRTYAQLWHWVTGNQLAMAIDEVMGICYGDPQSDPRHFQYHAAVSLVKPAAETDMIRRIDLPGGPYARYRLIGPYDQIGSTFDRLFCDWLPASGCELDDRPCLEILRNSPNDTPAEKLITDLLIPIRK